MSILLTVFAQTVPPAQKGRVYDVAVQFGVVMPHLATQDSNRHLFYVRDLLQVLARWQIPISKDQFDQLQTHVIPYVTSLLFAEEPLPVGWCIAVFMV